MIDQSELDKPSKDNFLTLNELKLPSKTHENNEDDDDSTVCYSARSFTSDFKNEIQDALYYSDTDDKKQIEKVKLKVLSSLTKEEEEEEEEINNNYKRVKSDKISSTNNASLVSVPNYECEKYVSKKPILNPSSSRRK